MARRIVYDLACPTIGTYNMKLFRDDAQYAADYLEDQLLGRRCKRRSGPSNSSMAIFTKLGSTLDAIALILMV
jgi:hypothetical protein